MSSYSDGCNAFPDPIGVSWPVFDFENEKLLFDVANLGPDRENMDFSSGNGLAISKSCEATAGQDINLSNSGEDALLYMYEPTMEFLGLQEIINPTLISNKQKTAAAIYGPSLSVDYGERAVYPVSKSIGSSEKIGYNANHLLYGIPREASRTMQNTKSDPYVTESVLETNAQVIPKKWKKDRHKAFSSKDREEKSSTDIDVTRQVTPELLPNIVAKEPSAKSGNDCIYVRAGRGQATDSHSLGERVRRKKISDRMNILRNLVPGCDQVTNKTLLLEEIINYVQSLQNQIEILSMKLQYISSLPTFDQELTGHPFKELLQLEATTDCMIADRFAPLDVDHTHTVALHQTTGTSI